MKRIRLICTLAAFMISMTVVSTSAERKYHDDVTGICDTVLVLDSPTLPSLTMAVETRGRIPSAKRLNGPSECRFGVIWNATDKSNFHYATLRPVDDDAYDYVSDSRHVLLEIGKMIRGENILILTRRLSSDIGLSDSENSIAVETDCRTGNTLIYAGNKGLNLVAETSVTPVSKAGIGLICDGLIEISLAVTESEPDLSYQLCTTWTEERLIASFTGNNANPVVGFWKYLDRDNDHMYARMGGEYNIAVTPNESGSFDIIYLGGARVNASEWKPGMIKGRLIPTIFTDHYDLNWYDASMRPIDRECSATIEQGAILRLDFPLLKTSIRYSKIPLDKL